MRLESGPAKTDALWHLGRMVVFLGVAVWFAYDGAIGWPNKNRAEAEKKLSAPEPFGGRLTYDELPESPTKADFDRLTSSPPATAADLHAALGEPQVTHNRGQGQTTEYFAGRWGYLSVPLRNGQVNAAGLNWQAWYKTQGDLRLQFIIAVIACIPGLYFLWKLVKAVTLRVLIDDEGMVYAGQRIRFADMVSLRDYSPKGWIDLYHRLDNQDKRLRLDNQKVALFDEIVDAICQAKGFENEVKAYAEREAREEAEEEAGETPTQQPADQDDRTT